MWSVRRVPVKYVDNTIRRSSFIARDDRRSCACLERNFMHIKYIRDYGGQHRAVYSDS